MHVLAVWGLCAIVVTAALCCFGAGLTPAADTVARPRAIRPWHTVVNEACRDGRPVVHHSSHKHSCTLHVLSGFGHADLCSLTPLAAEAETRHHGITRAHSKLLEAGLLRWKHNQHGTVRAGRKGMRDRPQHPPFCSYSLDQSFRTHSKAKGLALSAAHSNWEDNTRQQMHQQHLPGRQWLW